MAIKKPTQQRILVVDASERFRRDIKTFLQKHAAHNIVDEAASVREFMETANVSRPDVVLIDVDILKQDGWAIVYYLRSCLPLAVLAATANSDEDEYQTVAKEAGAIACISKKQLFDGLMPVLRQATVATNDVSINQHNNPSTAIAPSRDTQPESVGTAVFSSGLWWRPRGWREWLQGVSLFGTALVHGAPLDASPPVCYWRYIQAAMLFLAAVLLAALPGLQASKASLMAKALIGAALLTFVLVQIQHMRRLSAMRGKDK